jgi:hypothetical protein
MADVINLHTSSAFPRRKGAVALKAPRGLLGAGTDMM